MIKIKYEYNKPIIRNNRAIGYKSYIEHLPKEYSKSGWPNTGGRKEELVKIRRYWKKILRLISNIKKRGKNNGKFIFF